MPGIANSVHSKKNNTQPVSSTINPVMALASVRVMCSWPTISENRSGRYFRARTRYATAVRYQNLGAAFAVVPAHAQVASGVLRIRSGSAVETYGVCKDDPTGRRRRAPQGAAPAALVEVAL